MQLQVLAVELFLVFPGPVGPGSTASGISPGRLTTAASGTDRDGAHTTKPSGDETMRMASVYHGNSPSSPWIASTA